MADLDFPTVEKMKFLKSFRILFPDVSIENGGKEELAELREMLEGQVARIQREDALKEIYTPRSVDRIGLTGVLELGEYAAIFYSGTPRVGSDHRVRIEKYGPAQEDAASLPARDTV